MTVAALKRRLVPGTTLALVRACWLTPGEEVERVVKYVNTVDIVFEPSDFSKGKVSHLSIPKASALRGTEKGFVISDTGENPDPRFELEYELR